MGQKTFSDWDGRRRKAKLRPKLLRPILRGGLKRNRPGGFKTKVDRFFSELKQFYEKRKRRRIIWEQYRIEGYPDRGPDSHGLIRLWGLGNDHCKWHLKAMRKLKQDYVKKNVYIQVLAAAKERLKKCVFSSY